jgi:hypothetical protein
MQRLDERGREAKATDITRDAMRQPTNGGCSKK